VDGYCLRALPASLRSISCYDQSNASLEGSESVRSNNVSIRWLPARHARSLSSERLSETLGSKDATISKWKLHLLDRRSLDVTALVLSKRMDGKCRIIKVASQSRNVARKDDLSANNPAKHWPG
jgi:hypothetical protein